MTPDQQKAIVERFDKMWHSHDGNQYKDEWHEFIFSEIETAVKEDREDIVRGVESLRIQNTKAPVEIAEAEKAGNFKDVERWTWEYGVNAAVRSVIALIQSKKS